MKHLRKILFTLSLFLLICVQANAETLTGKVVGVSDGDTITVLDQSNKQHKIRLKGIDAPESGQAFGENSKQHLSELIFGKNVTVVYEKLDKYGRIVGKVLLDGKDICLEQIKAGFAWHYKYYQNEQTEDERKEYAAAENKAWELKIGLWQDRYPTAPWEYRESRNNNSSSDASSQTETQKKSQDIKSSSTTQSVPRPSTPSRVYIRGPRGGCYYINSNGNKTYVDRSLCN